MKYCNWIVGFMLAGLLVIVPPARAQQMPLTQKQVESLVSSGLGDESSAKMVEERGIDFAPSEDFLESLKAAGANDVFIESLREAKHPRPTGASVKKPLNQVQVFALLAAQVPSHRVAILVEERGIDFEPTDDYLQEVSVAGGEGELVNALKNARVLRPASVDPEANTRQVQVRSHAARGAEFFQEKDYAAAEEEYGAAVRLDPQNADLHVALSRALNAQGKMDAALSEGREAVRLNPESDLGHFAIGSVLGHMGDSVGAITEYREALRLNPNNELAHNNLGFALGNAGDPQGAMAEYREALRLNPNNDTFHMNLASALGNQGDMEGEIREAREALRINPGNEDAHVGLGYALGRGGDLDGEIAEERSAIRLNPNDSMAHYNLGIALEGKGELRSALGEFRTACSLDGNNETYRQEYERLSLQVNP